MPSPSTDLTSHFANIAGRVLGRDSSYTRMFGTSFVEMKDIYEMLGKGPR